VSFGRLLLRGGLSKTSEVNMSVQFNSLYKFYAGTDWRWFKAIAIVESGENPYAIGDSGLAAGLFQMHPDWWQDYGLCPPDWRWVPAVAMRALRRFWDHSSKVTVPDRVKIFHYGFHKWQELAGADPDLYLARVKAAMETIQGL
jgi:hypothetical protein